MKPLLLDLFCGAGGAAMGYHRAGFEVVGVDIAPQPRYPFTFYEDDALAVLDRVISGLGMYDAIHASPPCQDHSSLSAMHPEHGTGWMLLATVERLLAQDRPWVVENVEGAPLLNAPSLFGDRHGVMLCGSMFGLGVRRHRLFESNLMLVPLQCRHAQQGEPVDVTGHSAQGESYKRRAALGLPQPTKADKCRAMGIDWMTNVELSQAIPPAYSEHIGTQLLASLSTGVE